MVNKSADHIRYSRQMGFAGITPKDKEQWMRKYPHIDDFDLTVEEGQAWLSENWNKSRMAEERPRDFLDSWLSCKWLKLNIDGYKEPETIYNPKQLSSFIEQYFINGELIKRLTLGKKSGLTDSLATEHYEKALGHAVKLRIEVPDLPETPDARRKPVLDLRRLQEWCVKADKVGDGLFLRIKGEDIEQALRLLRELGELLKSGPPPIDETVWDGIKAKVQTELERLVKVIEELDEPRTTLRVTPTAQFEFKAKFWIEQAILGRGCELLLKKLEKHSIRVPDDQEELAEMITAAEWMAKTDWDRAKAIVEDRESRKAADVSTHELNAQMSVLSTAQTAEEKIHVLAWKRYCRETPNFDEAAKQAEEHIVSLFDGAADILNSNKTLLKVAYLKDNRLVSAFERLYDSLFSTSALRPGYSEPLQEIIDELEAILEHIGEAARQEPAETEQDIPPTIFRRIWTGIKKIRKWVYYFVGFLAALLTCIYLLWWLLTKIFSGPT